MTLVVKNRIAFIVATTLNASSGIGSILAVLNGHHYLGGALISLCLSGIFLQVATSTLYRKWAQKYEEQAQALIKKQQEHGGDIVWLTGKQQSELLRKGYTKLDNGEYVFNTNAAQGKIVTLEEQSRMQTEAKDKEKL